MQDTKLLVTGGIEKILRIYDLNRFDASPREIDKSPGSVRTVAWLHSDQTILSSCTDMGGVRYASFSLVLSFALFAFFCMLSCYMSFIVIFMIPCLSQSFIQSLFSARL